VKYWYLLLIMGSLQAMQSSDDEGPSNDKERARGNSISKEVALLIKQIKRLSILGNSQEKPEAQKNDVEKITPQRKRLPLKKRPNSEQEYNQLIKAIREEFPNLCDEEVLKMLDPQLKKQLKQSKHSKEEKQRHAYLACKRLSDSPSSSEKSE